jgi:four helix bundle protein
MQDFRNLKVWQRAHQLVLDLYAATRPFPTDERYGLTSQMRRAAMSVATNIAEGCGRGSDQDFARFLQIAMGSASEVEYLLLLARDLKLLDEPRFAALDSHCKEVKRMLASLLGRLRADS